MCGAVAAASTTSRCFQCCTIPASTSRSSLQEDTMPSPYLMRPLRCASHGFVLILEQASSAKVVLYTTPSSTQRLNWKMTMFLCITSSQVNSVVYRTLLSEILDVVRNSLMINTLRYMRKGVRGCKGYESAEKNIYLAVMRVTEAVNEARRNTDI